MLLSITTTHTPATDLGYLLAKHPQRAQTFKLSFGHAHVLYPRADEAICTACLLLDVDPVKLVRGGDRRQSKANASLQQYVNDRPYVASSFLSVAIARVLSSALKGECKDRPELVELPLPLELSLPVVPSRGGEGLIRWLFEPLGYAVEARRLALDEAHPEWGESNYFSLKLEATIPLKMALRHLYVLLPVLDNKKHYWVGRDELQKLLERGLGWLEDHPARDAIVSRYLKNQRGLAQEATARLEGEEVEAPPEPEDRVGKLNAARIEAVLGVLREAGAARVVDLGCGEGRLVRALLEDPRFTQVTGVDVSHHALEIAYRKLKVKRMPEAQRARLDLFLGALTYRDARIEGFDAACVIEVIEHLEPSRLGAFERVVFAHARPPTIVLTTPNVEHNARIEGLLPGKPRHSDHRFEWTRAEFEAWASGVAERYGYAVRFAPIGPVDDEVGAPTQMGVFSR